jgi:HAD superfamily hydrolase (TIGR01490 family)
VTIRQVARALAFLAAYRLGIVDMDRATREALQTVKGEREDDVREWTRVWFRDEVVPREAPGARAALAAHRARGHRLVLLTSTSPYESALAAAHFDLDAFLSTRYEVRDGRFTGEPLLPLCYGEGKVRHAEGWARREGVDLERSYFYTDSYTDLPMLRRAGRPRVVCPDLRLRLAARRRGWPVLDWSRPDGPLFLAGDDEPR